MSGICQCIPPVPAHDANTSSGYRCATCGLPIADLGFGEDHAIRRSRGGRGSVQRSHRAEGRNWSGE